MYSHDEEPEETEYHYTYAFLCAEGTDPADQLDQDFYDINHNYARYGKLLPASICTKDNEIPEHITKTELKELLESIDEKAANEDSDGETPNEYYEGIFETTNEIRRKYGLPLNSQ